MQYIANSLMVERKFMATMTLGYPGSFHNVTILRHSQLYHEPQTRFDHTIDYFEYLLGDLGNKGVYMHKLVQFRTKTYPLRMDFMDLTHKPKKLA